MSRAPTLTPPPPKRNDSRISGLPVCHSHATARHSFAAPSLHPSQPPLLLASPPIPSRPPRARRACISISRTCIVTFAPQRTVLYLPSHSSRGRRPFQCLRSSPRSIQRTVHHYDRLEISHSLSSHLPSPATAEAVVRAVSDDPRWAQVPCDWPSRASPPKEIILYGNDKSHAVSCQWHPTAAPHREAVAARQALTAWKKSPLRAISESGSCTGEGGASTRLGGPTK